MWINDDLDDMDLEFTEKLNSMWNGDNENKERNPGYSGAEIAAFLVICGACFLMGLLFGLSVIA